MTCVALGYSNGDRRLFCPGWMERRWGSLTRAWTDTHATAGLRDEEGFAMVWGGRESRILVRTLRLR